ncbi:MAG: hypothetical protein QG626_458, partial [Patescibacteria group bacterium]|nr:hypothetical protein [Patescibacteria group bacterium]
RPRGHPRPRGRVDAHEHLRHLLGPPGLDPGWDGRDHRTSVHCADLRHPAQHACRVVRFLGPDRWDRDDRGDGRTLPRHGGAGPEEDASRRAGAHLLVHGQGGVSVPRLGARDGLGLSRRHGDRPDYRSPVRGVDALGCIVVVLHVGHHA